MIQKSQAFIVYISDDSKQYITGLNTLLNIEVSGSLSLYTFTTMSVKLQFPITSKQSGITLRLAEIMYWVDNLNCSRLKECCSFSSNLRGETQHIIVLPYYIKINLLIPRKQTIGKHADSLFFEGAFERRYCNGILQKIQPGMSISRLTFGNPTKLYDQSRVVL